MTLRTKSEELQEKEKYPNVDKDKEYSLAPGIAMMMASNRPSLVQLAISSECDPRVKELMQLCADLLQDRKDLQADVRLYKESWHEAMQVIEDVRKLSAAYISKECG